MQIIIDLRIENSKNTKSNNDRNIANITTSFQEFLGD